ncbi:alpha/beta hydrolase [uncultured Roseibium sp.]|uniref:alpha/beta hydrolase n=1 Tax=uncultured Roseibium sp. TaxID=1936171 RepID=UPI0026310BFA|nr:alpha/beta hydrolase [uncultured Roseibium sp.]
MTDLDERRTWDPQFRFSDVLDDFDDWLRWRDDTSRTVGHSHSFKRVAYGMQERQWVEMSECGVVQSTVVPVFIHGGYWRGLNAEGHRCVLPGLSSFGSKCANVEYRLMPTVRMQDLVNDAAAALDTLSAHHPENMRFLLVGHSAGAHLAVSALQGAEKTGRVAGIVAVSGVYDLEPVAKSFLQDEIGLTEDEIRSHSLIGTEVGVPLVCVVGGEETDEFQRQSRAMADGAGAGHIIVRGAHHLSILSDLNSQKSPLIDALSVWLNNASHPAEVDTISS